MAWREARLHLAGFDPEAASRLAREEAIDLHALLDLIDHGCPPHLAARILAPLDGGNGAVPMMAAVSVGAVERASPCRSGRGPA